MAYEDLVHFIDLNGQYIQESEFEIEPFFNGETLLHPRALEMIEVISGAGLRLGELDTNFGMHIDITRLARLPIRRLTVNIGGLDKQTNKLVMGTNLERVLMNVKELMGEADRSFDVCLKMNPVQANLHQVDQMDIFVRRLHPALHWKAQQTGLPVPFDLSRNELAQFLLETYSSDRSDLFRFRLTDDGNSIVPRNNNCLYMTPCINANGSVTICAHDQLRHYSFGNIFRDRLKDIFASTEYHLAVQKGKKRGLEICHGCN
ncbi:hypothetical protein FACS1894158_02540 [Betaproteobacteria bacterium]|nr:hypothetical protein FACS1894158_02540 [Betaproteobacteria bacterium]